MHNFFEDYLIYLLLYIHILSFYYFLEIYVGLILFYFHHIQLCTHLYYEAYEVKNKKEIFRCLLLHRIFFLIFLVMKCLRSKKSKNALLIFLLVYIYCFKAPSSVSTQGPCTGTTGWPCSVWIKTLESASRKELHTVDSIYFTRTKQHSRTNEHTGNHS